MWWFALLISWPSSTGIWVQVQLQSQWHVRKVDVCQKNMHVLQLNDGLPTHKATQGWRRRVWFLCSSLSFAWIHYSDVILLHFSILSICHCSLVVMEDQRSVLRLFVSDLFITHPLQLLPPLLFLVLFQFIKTWLHKNSSLWTSTGSSLWHENLCELLNNSEDGVKCWVWVINISLLINILGSKLA